jgi:hypothetical protein
VHVTGDVVEIFFQVADNSCLVRYAHESIKPGASVKEILKLRRRPYDPPSRLEKRLKASRESADLRPAFSQTPPSLGGPHILFGSDNTNVSTIPFNAFLGYRPGSQDGGQYSERYGHQHHHFVSGSDFGVHHGHHDPAQNQFSPPFVSKTSNVQSAGNFEPRRELTHPKMQSNDRSTSPTEKNPDALSTSFTDNFVEKHGINGERSKFSVFVSLKHWSQSQIMIAPAVIPKLWSTMSAKEFVRLPSLRPTVQVLSDDPTKIDEVFTDSLVSILLDILNDDLLVH